MLKYKIPQIVTLTLHFLSVVQSGIMAPEAGIAEYP